MDLKKLLGPKKSINPAEKEAKLGALEGMKHAAGKMMAEDFDGMNKVTVAAPDEKGLRAGLDKAEDVLDSEAMNDDENMEEVAGAIPETTELPETIEDIDKLMEKLMEKKQALEKAE